MATCEAWCCPRSRQGGRLDDHVEPAPIACRDGQAQQRWPPPAGTDFGYSVLPTT